MTDEQIHSFTCERFDATAVAPIRGPGGTPAFHPSDQFAERPTTAAGGVGDGSPTPSLIGRAISHGHHLEALEATGGAHEKSPPPKRGA